MLPEQWIQDKKSHWLCKVDGCKKRGRHEKDSMCCLHYKISLVDVSALKILPPEERKRSSTTTKPLCKVGGCDQEDEKIKITCVVIITLFTKYLV
jgi:hypothetical protein